MLIDININKTLNFKPGWPVYELYDQNDNFINLIELIPDGWIGINRDKMINRWCIFMDNLCFIDDTNNISILFHLIDEEKFIFKGFSTKNKNFFYLKFIKT